MYSISLFFRFSGLKKSRALCTTFILNPVLYQKFCLCISNLVSGSTTRLLLPLLVMLNSFEKSTLYLPSKMLLKSRRSLRLLVSTSLLVKFTCLVFSNLMGKFLGLFKSDLYVLGLRQITLTEILDGFLG